MLVERSLLWTHSSQTTAFEYMSSTSTVTYAATADLKVVEQPQILAKNKQTNNNNNKTVLCHDLLRFVIRFRLLLGY